MFLWLLLLILKAHVSLSYTAKHCSRSVDKRLKAAGGNQEKLTKLSFRKTYGFYITEHLDLVDKEKESVVRKFYKRGSVKLR